MLVCVSHFDVVRIVESQEMINETGEKIDEKVLFFFSVYFVPPDAVNLLQKKKN